MTGADAVHGKSGFAAGLLVIGVLTGCGQQASPQLQTAPTSISSPVARIRPVGEERATGCWSEEQRVKGEDVPKQYSEPPAMRVDPEKSYTGTIETNKGAIGIELYPQEAPATVNNFVCLADDGYYDGTPFHRIVQGFVIQGGDPTGTGMGGPGYRFNDEPVSREYEKGILAMANAGPNTNGSQFFIVLEDLRGILPKNYTIFGRVTSGLDVVDAIASTPTVAGRSGEKSTPTEPVTLEKVSISES